jgi:hypothetical protein
VDSQNVVGEYLSLFVRLLKLPSVTVENGLANVPQCYNIGKLPLLLNNVLRCTIFRPEL